MMVILLDWDTNATNSSKIDFNDGVVAASPLQPPNLGPGVVGWIVLEHKQDNHITSQRIPHSTSSLESVTPSLGTPTLTKTDEFLENFQTPSDPPWQNVKKAKCQKDDVKMTKFQK